MTRKREDMDHKNLTAVFLFLVISILTLSLVSVTYEELALFQPILAGAQVSTAGASTTAIKITSIDKPKNNEKISSDQYGVIFKVKTSNIADRKFKVMVINEKGNLLFTNKEQTITEDARQQHAFGFSGTWKKDIMTQGLTLFSLPTLPNGEYTLVIEIVDVNGNSLSPSVLAKRTFTYMYVGADLCKNKVKDSGETDIDCGGTKCTKCEVDKTCAVDNDCTTKKCDATIKKCVSPPVSATCNDGIKNGVESDVDCGGYTCVQNKKFSDQCSCCVVGKMCTNDNDCSSKKCDGATKKCIITECTPGEKQCRSRQDFGPVSKDALLTCGSDKKWKVDGCPSGCDIVKKQCR